MCSRLLFFACLIVASACAQTPQFTIQDLGTLPNLPSCHAEALSQSGNVTGYCGGSKVNLLTEPTVHGFLYSNGVITDLNLTNGTTPLPTAVNDSGVVAGAFVKINRENFSGTGEPFVFQNGTVTLPTGPMNGVLPFALNNAGQLVGGSFNVSAASTNVFIDSTPVVYAVAKGATTVLPTQSGTGAAALGINASGTVAGAGVGELGTFTPLLWQNGALQTLPMLSGYKQSMATSVNDSGVAAGFAFDLNFSVLSDPSAVSHAVLFNADGSVTDLGVVANTSNSMALGINNSGWVVGFSTNNLPDFSLGLAASFYPAATSYHAFLYANGTMNDLTSLLTNGTGWTLSFANAVNNAGQIAGTGIYLGQAGPVEHAFLLTPVPAAPVPAITSIAGAGLSVPGVTTLSNNGLFTVFGTVLASGTTGLSPATIVNNQLPTNLGGTCVQGGNTKWGLFFVSPTQINALAADLPASGTVPVSVITNCGTANEVATPAVNVAVAAAAPEFLYFVLNANGQDPVAAVQSLTGAYVGPPGLVAGATFTPAHAGDFITAYGVGWGATTSTEPIGTLASSVASLTNHYSLTLGGKPVAVSYAGLSPDSAGLYQINFTVPSGLAAGNQPLVLTVDGISSPAQAYIAVSE